MRLKVESEGLDRPKSGDQKSEVRGIGYKDQTLNEITITMTGGVLI